MSGSERHNCECADTHCPEHPGLACGHRTRTRTLFRVDMHDVRGTRFCAACADDAMQSGLFHD
jgi:phage/plasmid primase-like uncharacterized protein